MNHLIRGLCLAAVLMAGSCAAPAEGPPSNSQDGAVNHPITVEPSYQSLRVFYSPADHGLAPADAGRFDGFVSDYRDHGNGAIAVNAPSGMGAPAAIAFFAQRINDMGVPKDRILVATHDAPDGDMRVEINYVSYTAHTDACGDWSDDLAYTMDNDTAKNFGCAVQQNIAAMVADPRDLISPRGMEDADANRRGDVLTKYQQGKITQADKNKTDKMNEQSGTSSDVSRQ